MTLQAIDRAITRFGRIVGHLLDAFIGVLLAGLLAVVFSQFVDRNYVTFWTDSPEEYVKIGLTWLCFVGLARAFATGEAIHISFLHDIVPAWMSLAIDTLIDGLILVVLFILVAKSVVMVEMADYQIILGTDFSLAVPATGVLVGFVLLVPLIAWRLIRRLAVAAGRLEGAP